ncbi:MAG: YcgN family cysteine cluster protein [Pseudomonadales bacterium]
MVSGERFWETKPLSAMTDAEWEALCDGCARCCMIKLEDEDTGEVHYTSLVCDLLDIERCRCTRYPQRHELMPDCIEFDADLAATLTWLPASCAYRRLAEGRGLAAWHPLVSGDPDSVHRAGISVRGRVVPAAQVDEDDQQDHVIRWVEL